MEAILLLPTVTSTSMLSKELVPGRTLSVSVLMVVLQPYMLGLPEVNNDRTPGILDPAAVMAGLAFELAGLARVYEAGLLVLA